MRATASAILLASLVVFTIAPSHAQTDDGHVGVFFDAAGTQPCATVNQYTTLYVIAKLAGASAAGITGAEFRIEVESPSGWHFSYTAPTAATVVIGNPIDTDPQDPGDGAGLTIAFATCQTPVNGQVGLGTIFVYKESGAPPTYLLTKAHSSPSNANFQCPLFILCDGPYFSMVCMSNTSESCMLHKTKKATTGEDPANGRVFATAINIDVDAPARSITGSDLVEALRSERKIPVSFVMASSEHEVALTLGRPVEDILEEMDSKSAEYRHRTVNGRLVIYPRLSGLEQIVQPPAAEVTDVGWFMAAAAYILWLREHVPGFETLLPPAFVGDPRTLEHDEHVTLAPGATVLEHFLQLLGSNPNRFFEITPLPPPSGMPMFRFNEVSWIPEAPTAPSKAGWPHNESSACACGIDYGSPQTGGCPAFCSDHPGPPGFSCGGAIDYLLIKVRENTSNGCNGCLLTESVTQSGFFGTGPVRTGGPFTVGLGGTVLPAGAADCYSVCALPEAVPANSSVAQVLHQRLFVCFQLVDEATITFHISRDATSGCSTTVTREITKGASDVCITPPVAQFQRFGAFTGTAWALVDHRNTKRFEIRGFKSRDDWPSHGKVISSFEPASSIGRHFYVHEGLVVTGFSYLCWAEIDHDGSESWSEPFQATEQPNDWDQLRRVDAETEKVPSAVVASSRRLYFDEHGNVLAACTGPS